MRVARFVQSMERVSIMCFDASALYELKKGLVQIVLLIVAMWNTNMYSFASFLSKSERL